MKIKNNEFKIRKNPCWGMGPKGWFMWSKYFSGKVIHISCGPLMIVVDGRGEGGEWVANAFGVCPKHSDRVASGIAAGCKVCRALRPDKIKEVEKSRDELLREIFNQPTGKH